MRWPLKNQILVRMLLLLTIAIGAITFANIRSTIVTSRNAELSRLQSLVDLATTARFPLSSSVLENMKSLSGAEFVLIDERGRIQSKTSAAPTILPDRRSARENDGSASPTTVDVAGNPYYHTSVKNLQNPTTTTGLLHIYVPRQSERSIWWQASKSPLTIALLVLPLAFLISYAMASQVTRPLAHLESKVKQIADGDIPQIPKLRGNDEIQDLNTSINEMADKLQDHDAQLRKNERLRTMVQFGSSIAHHLRNSATGCKMAVELLGAENESLAKSENYQVAIRQLGLMNNYIKKFLLLSKSPETSTTGETPLIALDQVLTNVVFLLRPSATHLNVDLSVQSDCDQSRTRMTEEDAEQLMMNLVTNAITAASRLGTGHEAGKRAVVSVRLVVNEGRVLFSVTDNGTGPPADIAQTLFQPFVTGSPEGTGLGLSLVDEISKRAGGQVRWSRENDTTIFTYEFSNPSPDQSPTVA